MKRRALVTGGAGFIGSHVSDLLLAEGWEVAIIDNLASGNVANVPKTANFHELDIGSREAGELIQRGSFDLVCHLAAQIDVRKSLEDPVQDARTNLLGSLNLLEAVRKSGRATRVVFSSTGGAMYGAFSTPPCPESTVKEPEAPYGISKMSVEYYMAYYARLHKLQTVALRYSNVYGPRQDPHGEAGVVAIFCGRILDGRTMTIFGNGGQTRDYVFVGDVARANLAAATATLPAPGGVDARAFNVGTGQETSVVQLADILISVSGGTAARDFVPARPGELDRSAVDPARAIRELGWKPSVSIRDGLGQTFAWFAERHKAQAKAATQ